MANIEQRGKNSYRFTVSLPRNAKGIYPKERTTYTVKGKYTPKQLEEHLNHEYLKFKSLVLSGKYVRPDMMIFSDFVEEWKEKFADREFEETTFVNRQNALKNHILPVIGHMQMDKVNTFILVDLMDNLNRKDGKPGDLSVSTKEDIYKALQSVFKYAVQWHVIADDPMDGVNKPKSKRSNKKESLNIYEPDEITKLFEAAENEAFHWRLFIALALTAGLRRSELLGLEWSKVDFENKQIDIDTVIVKGKSGAVIKSPKSAASERLIALPDSMMQELLTYRRHWAAEKIAVGIERVEKEREWIFCNPDGTHFYPDTPSTWWKRFTTKNELRHIRLHDLRHTSASLLIARGEHAKVIADRLGHSKIAVTMDTYGHLLRSADHNAASKLDDLLPVREIK